MRVIFLLLVLCNLSVFAQQNRHALIIAIGNYNEEVTGWHRINSANDVPLIEKQLINKDFDKDNIKLIQDENATKEGVLNSFMLLLQGIEKGDVVYIHYSGHGQQISDINGDEIDGLDEALVPIDAPSGSLYYKNYNGEKHITDDELGSIIYKIRHKAGLRGQVIVVLDACHSGTAARGSSVVRGGKEPFVFEKNGKTTFANDDKSGFADYSNTRSMNSGLAPCVIISASQPHQLNFETKDANGRQVGSLTYSLARTLNNSFPYSTYSKVFSETLKIMKVLAPYQEPMIEGDVNYKVFNGEYTYQQPYFSIEELINKQTIKINGGLIAGLNEGDSVAVCSGGVASLKTADILNAGIVVSTNNYSSVVVLNNTIPNESFRIFKTHSSTPDLSSVILNSKYYDPEYFIELELIPVHLKRNKMGGAEIGNNGYVVADTLSITNYFEQGKLVFPKEVSFLLKFTNSGSKKAFFAVIDIQPDSIINRVYPSKNMPVEECYLLPGMSFTPSNLVINGFSPPFGKEHFVVLANGNPINVSSIITPVTNARSFTTMHGSSIVNQFFKKGSVTLYPFYIEE